MTRAFRGRVPHPPLPGALRAHGAGSPRRSLASCEDTCPSRPRRFCVGAFAVGWGRGWRLVSPVPLSAAVLPATVPSRPVPPFSMDTVHRGPLWPLGALVVTLSLFVLCPLGWWVACASASGGNAAALCPLLHSAHCTHSGASPDGPPGSPSDTGPAALPLPVCRCPAVFIPTPVLLVRVWEQTTPPRLWDAPVGPEAPHGVPAPSRSKFYARPLPPCLSGPALVRRLPGTPRVTSGRAAGTSSSLASAGRLRASTGSADASPCGRLPASPGGRGSRSRVGVRVLGCCSASSAVPTSSSPVDGVDGSDRCSNAGPALRPWDLV